MEITTNLNGIRTVLVVVKDHPSSAIQMAGNYDDELPWAAVRTLRRLATQKGFYAPQAAVTEVA